MEFKFRWEELESSFMVTIRSSGGGNWINDCQLELQTRVPEDYAKITIMVNLMTFALASQIHIYLQCLDAHSIVP